MTSANPLWRGDEHRKTVIALDFPYLNPSSSNDSLL
jgi:hypothetical protein